MAIKRKKKICRHCKLPKFIFSDGLCNFCYKRKSYHKTLKKAKELAKEIIKKRPKPIRKVSKNLRNLQNDYKKVRAIYFKEHPCCEVRLPGCTGCDERLITLHHRKGRIGTLLTNPEFFLTACISCHSIIESNPELAYENGWSLSRLAEE